MRIRDATVHINRAEKELEEKRSHGRGECDIKNHIVYYLSITRNYDEFPTKFRIIFNKIMSVLSVL